MHVFIHYPPWNSSKHPKVKSFRGTPQTVKGLIHAFKVQAGIWPLWIPSRPLLIQTMSNLIACNWLLGICNISLICSWITISSIHVCVVLCGPNQRKYDLVSFILQIQILISAVDVFNVAYSPTYFHHNYSTRLFTSLCDLERNLN